MSEENKVPSNYGIMIEVDNLFFNGIKTASDAVANKLQVLGIATNPFTFVKSVYGRTYSRAVSELAPEYNNAEVNELAMDISDAQVAEMQQKAKLPEELKSFIKLAVAADLKVILATRLSADVAQELIDGLKLPADAVISITDTSLVAGVTPYDVWRRGASRARIATRNTVAICAGGTSMRCAICSGMHAVVKMDPALAFEDCSGADFIVNKLDKNLIENIRQILKVK